jgi:hypothetical protein
LGSGTGLPAGAVGIAADCAGAALGGGGTDVFAGGTLVAVAGGGLSGWGWPGAAGGGALTRVPDGGGSGSAVMAEWLLGGGPGCMSCSGGGSAVAMPVPPGRFSSGEGSSSRSPIRSL